MICLIHILTKILFPDQMGNLGIIPIFQKNILLMGMQNATVPRKGEPDPAALQ